MSIAGGVVIFTVIWWIVFFMALPFGVRNPAETGSELVPGQEHGAPVRPMLWRKAAITTVIAVIATVLLWASGEYGWVDWRGLIDPAA